MSPSKLTLSLRITGYPAASKGALFTDLCKSVVDEIPPFSIVLEREDELPLAELYALGPAFVRPSIFLTALELVGKYACIFLRYTMSL